ncbi:amidohydrolase family protein [Histidinibacterium lentulum]|uniref:amidohydrolase family protein n=1 Tax=Histidinibacterium lentulum TaxID=2480588 RepID=UPI001C844163|nr:amidohydrolase [Histidinibacterium lentulum]
MIPLIDTHQHLIYPEVAGYGWTSGIPALSGAFTLPDYKALTEGQIAGSLFMETAVDDADIRAETDHVAGLMAEEGSDILGLIVSARPEEEDGRFVPWLEEVQAKGAVGVRRVLHVVDDEMSRSETFRANVRRIGAAGLAFDMCFLARQLPIARELAEACPDVRLVLDHCGVPDIAGGGLDPWREDIAALADLPHVRCKLSGLPAYCAPGTASAETLAHFVDHVLEVFGPSRICWGSDWPVVNLGPGLPGWLEITRQILGALTEDEALAIAQGTAREVYRLT